MVACAWCVVTIVEGVTAQPAPEREPEAGRDLPFVFKADTIEYDRTNEILTVRGSVEITQGERVLLADRVTYFQRPDILTAEGNVVLIDETRTVIFGDRVELSGDFKDGIIEGIRIRLADDSRLAATGARRTGGFRTEMRKAVYSPCMCEEAPEGAPLWQLKAMEVVHDEVSRDIEYTDAWLEFLGVPVFYLPYLSHPDPTVERRTGFLAPGYGNDSLLGVMVQLPFHIAFAPDQDATITPIITSEEGVVLSGEYRHLFPTARVNAEGSITHASVPEGGEDIRGHFFGNFGWDIDDTWRSQVDIAFTSDDTFLRRYDFDSRDTLVNHALVEGFWEKNYAAANAYGFQGLRAEDDQDRIPVVLPMFDFNYVSDPDPMGSFWTADANAMALTRTEGADSRRLSFKGGWHLPYTSPIGEVYRAYATVQTDGYWVDDVVRSDGSRNEFSGFTGRVFPQAGVDWRFPFIRPGENWSQIIEPVAGIIVAPNVGDKQDEIPNEDSLDIELDSTNIFAPNRFTGLDRVEGGHRVHYGLNAGLYGASGAVTSFFLGQSFRFRENEAFPEGSGLNDTLSDIVGRVQFAPVNWIDILYRFRVDTHFEPQRHEVVARLGTRRLFMNTQYVFIEQPVEGDEFGNREEITIEAGAQLIDNWSIRGRTIRDLREDGGQLFNAIGLTYANGCGCLTFSIDYSRRFFEDRDVQPSDSIFLRISLRTLGEVGTSTSP